jgi:hypothetical protein
MSKNLQQKKNSKNNQFKEFEKYYTDLTPDKNPEVFGYDLAKYSRYFKSSIRTPYKIRTFIKRGEHTNTSE